VDVFPPKPFVYDREMDGVSAFVLAGGKSTRMNADKAFVEFRGSTLLARALKLAANASSETWIVAPRQKFADFGKVVEDVFPNHGPLGGIHAALRASNTDLNLLLAVDLPFVEVSFVQYLLTQAQTCNAMATVPRAGGGWQPLCAVYRREFAEVAEGALKRGQNAIHRLLEDEIERSGVRSGIRAIEERELVSAGFPALMFRNINTVMDLESCEG